jgi:hypothetical protein
VGEGKTPNPLLPRQHEDLEITQPQSLVGPVVQTLVTGAWAALLLLDSTESEDND